MRRKLKEEVLEEFKEIHGDRYDYSKFEYNGNHERSIIICNEHGDFLQTPGKHKSGMGCKKCNNLKYNKSDIQLKLSEIFGDRYRFDLSDYKTVSSHIKVDCRHGQRVRKVTELLQGNECIFCVGRKWHESDLKIKLEEVHDKKYTYNTNFIVNSKELRVRCDKHGDFIIAKDKHLEGYGCRKCSKKKKYDQDFLIETLTNKHPNLDFSLTKYTFFKEEVIVICTEHGEFSSKIEYLLAGTGCKKCSWDKLRTNSEEFLKKCSEKHPELDYSETIYHSMNDKISVKCHIHGEFKQHPQTHLMGRGCPSCIEPIGEKKIRHYLESNNIEFEKHKRFKGCFYKNKLAFDFWIPNLKCCIEFDGMQHFKPIEYFGGEEKFKEQILKDSIKNEWCLENNIKLIRIKYNEDPIEILKNSLALNDI